MQYVWELSLRASHGVGTLHYGIERRMNMIAMNTIYSDAEYIAQGFRPDEVQDVRRSDVLFNKRQEWTAEEEEEYYTLVEKLGL